MPVQPRTAMPCSPEQPKVGQALLPACVRADRGFPVQYPQTVPGARPILGGAVLLALLAPVFQAQVEIPSRPKRAPKQDPSPRATLRVDTNLVLVPVSVNDPLSRPVSGLERENFRV